MTAWVLQILGVPLEEVEKSDRALERSEQEEQEEQLAQLCSPSANTLFILYLRQTCRSVNLVTCRCRPTTEEQTTGRCRRWRARLCRTIQTTTRTTATDR